MSRTIERIGALLAKAERTDNAHEAEAYLAKAQALATLASIDLASARLSAAPSGIAEPMARTVTIGEKGKRANTHLVALFVAVAHANSVIVDVAHNSTYVIAYGMPSNVDVVETLFASVAVHMGAAAQSFVDSNAWRSDTYRVREGRRSVKKNFTKQTARAAFQRSYVARIGERLMDVRDQVVKEQVAQDEARAGPSTVSSEIALREVESEVAEFHKRTSMARGNWSGYRGKMTGASGNAASAGRRAASRVRIRADGEISGGRRKISG